MAVDADGIVPVILVAAHGSGAGLLRRALAAHPEIAFAPSFDILTDAIHADGRFMKREAFLREASRSGALDRLGLTVPADLSFAGIAQNLVGQLGAAKPSARVIGITLQRDADRALWLWPEARFIHLVRDGRDVAMVEAAAGWAGNLWHGIADWAAIETLWERMANKLPPERRHGLRFEALIADPEPELRRLCAFLGVDFDPAMTGPFASPAPRGGLWRKAPAAELSAAEHAAARGLLQNGYLLSATVRAPNAIRRALFAASHRAAVARKRRKLLGLKRWMGSAARDLFRSKRLREREIARDRQRLEPKDQPD